MAKTMSSKDRTRLLDMLADIIANIPKPELAVRLKITPEKADELWNLNWEYLEAEIIH